MKTNLPTIALVATLAAVSALHAQTPVPAPEAAPVEKKETRIVIVKNSDKSTEKITFLGVETASVSAALASQLNLDKGTALLVKSVVAKSPAAGVLKENDLLLKIDDQVLIEPRQLGVLVRNHKDGDEVSVTYMRGGKQAEAKVKLLQRENPKMVFMHGPGMAPGMPHVSVNIEGAENRVDLDRVLSLMDEQNTNGQGKRVHIERVEGGPGLNSVTVVKNNSMIVSNDAAGTLTLTIKDGKKTLEAKNAKGEVVFSGPIDTPEQCKALPGDVGARLEKFESMQGVRFETDGDFKGRDVKVIKAPATSTAAPREDGLRSLTPSF